jgi:hypothetical protein
MESNKPSCARSILALMLCLLVITASTIPAQDAPPVQASVQKYKLTVVEGSSTTKRAKKNRVSSQSVVKITDENDVPVPGIAVTFTIPQLSGTGATFANGQATSIVTTNSAGVASSGTFTVVAGSTFSMGVGAAVPGATLTTTVPVAVSAVVAGAAVGAGISTGLLVGIIAGVGAAVAAGVVVASKSGGAGPAGTIGTPTAITFGHP